MSGWLIVLALMALILFSPAVIIVRSKRVSGWRKIKWVSYSLLPIIIVPFLVSAVVFVVLPTSEKNLGGLYSGPIMALATYLLVWIVLVLFRIKNPRKQMSI